ncbi:TPA: hypothetical protein EYP27_00370 [Candidatus Bathyarchaeota archaeon]|nr:hypothetical protein [Candidatus Bathyarchaeota archaeon]
MTGLEFPPEVLTRSKAGKLEVRALDSRGKFLMCKYLDPKTMKLADKKRKIILVDEEGRQREFFIIPLKDGRRHLMIEGEKEDAAKPENPMVWNEKEGKAEPLWK